MGVWEKGAGTEPLRRLPRRIALWWKHCLIWVVVIFLSVGCAPTATIKKTQDLSTSGIAYCEAVDQLVTVTLDRLIEDDSNRLIKQYEAFSLDDTTQQANVLKGFLQTSDDALLPVLKNMNLLQGQMGLLKSYFISLQSLANADVATGASQAVNNLSSSINTATSALKETPTVVVSPEETTALDNLAGLAAQWIQAGELQSALVRDGPIVGEYLMVQEKFVQAMAETLVDIQQRNNQSFKQQNVTGPYTNKTISDTNQWKQNRKTALSGSLFPQILDRLRGASQQLQSVWEGTLKGEDDIGSLKPILDEITGSIAVLTTAENG